MQERYHLEFVMKIIFSMDDFTTFKEDKLIIMILWGDKGNINFISFL